MNVTPKSAPTIMHPAASATPAGPTARERAIAMVQATPTPAQTEQTPVQNPNSVSPEELSAIRPPSQPQKDIIETPAESPAATEAPSKSEEPALSSQYAQLARKERAMRAKAQAMDASMKAKEAAFAEREAAIQAKEAEYQTKYVPKDRIAQDPWSVLTEAGLTYDQLTQLALNQQNQDPATKAALGRLEAQIKSTQDAQERAVKAQADAQAQQYRQAIQQIRTEASTLVKANPEAYETIAATDSVSDVVELIEETFKQDGIILTVEDAAQAVEEYLSEEAYKLANLRKIQQKLRPAAVPATTEPKKQTEAVPAAAKQPPTKTLSNSMSTSRQLSARERAILAFKGELKS